jgi:short-subunit dehydrogenase
MLRLKPLHEQVIVITGASSGIGLSTARLAARRGARVVLASRSKVALGQLATELSLAGGRAVAVTADVSDLYDVRRIANEARRAFGTIDTWVNNAAVSVYGNCTEVSLDDMRRIMDTNFWGVVHGSRVACEVLQPAGGALINLGSVLSDRAVPLQGAYSASKQAIKGWTEALRDELTHARAPISVTLIKPAAINTPYSERAANYLADHPTHVPPVYHVQSVAKAILHAAAHPTREIVVGSAGVGLSLGSTLLPGLVDSIMAHLMLPALHSGRPRHGRPNLYMASESLQEEGTYPGLVRPSLYTGLVTTPMVSRVLGGAALLLLGYAAAHLKNDSHEKQTEQEQLKIA